LLSAQIRFALVRIDAFFRDFAGLKKTAFSPNAGAVKDECLRTNAKCSHSSAISVRVATCRLVLVPSLDKSSVQLFFWMPEQP